MTTFSGHLKRQKKNLKTRCDNWDLDKKKKNIRMTHEYKKKKQENQQNQYLFYFLVINFYCVRRRRAGV